MVKLMSSLAIDDARDGICGFLGCVLWAVGCGLWAVGCGMRVAVVVVRVMRTEVQGISSVGYTRGEGSKPRLWNLQNLCPVPP